MDTTYTYIFDDDGPAGRRAKVRRPAHRHKFTINRDEPHYVRAGGSDGEIIGRVEQQGKRWFPFTPEGEALSSWRGHRRAGDAGSVLYIRYLKAGGMDNLQLSLFAQAKLVESKADRAEKKAAAPADVSERSPEYQARHRIELCAEWYHHHEGDSWAQAYAKCRDMEERGRLREDGSYIAVEKGRKAPIGSPQDAIDVAEGMMDRYSSPERARAMAFDHAMDHPRSSEQRAYWTSVIRVIEERAGLHPPISDGSAGLKKGRSAARRRRVRTPIPSHLWREAVEAMRAWIEAGEPEGVLYAAMQLSVTKVSARVAERSFSDVEARVRAEVEYGGRGQRASIGPDNIEKFRQAYKAAKRAGKETFMFEGQEVLVAYAKYVLEYFDGLGGR